MNIEKWSTLFTVLSEMKEPLTITKLAKQCGMHHDTVEGMLNFFQSAQEFGEKISIMGTTRKIVVKTPNLDKDSIINSKLDKIIKKLKC